MNRQFDSLPRREEGAWGAIKNLMLRSRQGIGPDAGVARNTDALKNNSIFAGRSLYGDNIGDRDSRSSTIGQTGMYGSQLPVTQMRFDPQPNRLTKKITTKLYVGNLPETCRTLDLENLFQKYGNVVECAIVQNYAFVHYDNAEDAKTAVDNLNGINFGGNTLKVEVSRSKVRQRPGMGGKGDCYRCGKGGHMSKDCPRGPVPHLRSQNPGIEDRFSNGERRMSTGARDRYSDNLADFNAYQGVGARQGNTDFDYPDDQDRHGQNFRDTSNSADLTVDQYYNRLPLQGGVELGPQDGSNYPDEREYQSSGQTMEDSWQEERFVEEEEVTGMDWKQGSDKELGLINKSFYQAGGMSRQQPVGMQQNTFSDRDESMLAQRSFSSDPHKRSYKPSDQRSPLKPAGRFQRHPADRSPTRASGRRSPARRRDGSSVQRSHFRDRRSPLRSADRSRSNSPDRPSRHSTRRFSPRSKDRSSDKKSSHKNTNIGSGSFSNVDAPESRGSKSNEFRSVSVTFVQGMMCPGCKGCGRNQTFATYTKFKMHWQKLHAKFRLVYSCPMQYCFESFSNNEKLLSHVRKEHNNGAVLNSRLETFLRQEVECLKVEKEPEIDPGNLTFTPVDREQKKVKKSSLTREAAIVESLLDTGTRPSLPRATVHPFSADSMAGRTSVNISEATTRHLDRFQTPETGQPGSSGFSSRPFPEMTPHYPVASTHPTPGPEARAGHSFPQRYPTSESDQPRPRDFRSQYKQKGNPKIEHKLKASSTEPVPIVFQPGMVCPICPNSKRCDVWNDYRNHWCSYHVQHFKRFRCPRLHCHVLANSQPTLRKHYRKLHNNGKDLIEPITQMLNAVESEEVPNENFVDPGSFTFEAEKQGKELEDQTTKCTTNDEMDTEQSGELIQTEPTTVVFQSGMKCPACKKCKPFTVENELRMHWQTRHIKICNRYPCPVNDCKSKMGSIKFLRKHYRRFHCSGQEIGDAELCEVNAVQSERDRNPLFIDPGNFTYDCGKVELGEEVEPETSDPVTIVFEPGMRCPICLKTPKFQKVYDLRNHWLLSHIEFNDRFACPYTDCTSVLASQLKLVKHYMKQHNYDEELDEETTNMLSTVKSARYRNMRYVHPGKYTFDYENEEIRKQNFDHVYKMLDDKEEEVMEI